MTAHPNLRFSRAEADDVVHGPNGLGLAERAVLWALVKHVNRKTGECYPSDARIAHWSGACERAVRQARAKLRAAGVLAWTATRNGQRSGANRYVINLDPLRARVAEGLATWAARRDIGEDNAEDNAEDAQALTVSGSGSGAITSQAAPDAGSGTVSGGTGGGSQAARNDVSGGTDRHSQAAPDAGEHPDLNHLKKNHLTEQRASARGPDVGSCVSPQWVIQRFAEAMSERWGEPYTPSQFGRTEGKDRSAAGKLVGVLRDARVDEAELAGCITHIVRRWVDRDEQWLNDNGHPLARLAATVTDEHGHLSEWKASQAALRGLRAQAERQAAEEAEQARRAALTPEERAAEQERQRAAQRSILEAVASAGRGGGPRVTRPAFSPNLRAMGWQDGRDPADTPWLQQPKPAVDPGGEPDLGVLAPPGPRRERFPKQPVPDAEALGWGREDVPSAPPPKSRRAYPPKQDPPPEGAKALGWGKTSTGD